MTEQQLADYEHRGDPDADSVPDRKDARRQVDAERIRQAATQMDLPPLTEATAQRVANLVGSWTPTPDHMLMRWRIRLFCGHVVERTAHVSYKTAQAAFGSLRACPECGLDPATVVAARPLGLASPPTATPAPRRQSRSAMEKLLAKAEAEVIRLRRELDDTDPTVT